MFSFLYTEILWRPLFNGLVFLYNIVPGQDLGLAIIALTVVIRVVLFPVFWKGQKAQAQMARIQPELKKIQQEHKNNREAQSKALMEFYAREKVNPFSGCLLLLLQLPILIALLRVFQSGLEPEQLQYLYSFVANPGAINTIGFRLLDLAKGNLVLGAIAAISQFYQTKLTIAKQPVAKDANDFARIMQWQTLYLFPLLILGWSYSLPAALTLYWTASNMFAIVQELISRFLTKRRTESAG